MAAAADWRQKILFAEDRIEGAALIWSGQNAASQHGFHMLFPGAALGQKKIVPLIFSDQMGTFGLDMCGTERKKPGLRKQFSGIADFHRDSAGYTVGRPCR